MAFSPVKIAKEIELGIKGSNLSYAMYRFLFQLYWHKGLLFDVSLMLAILELLQPEENENVNQTCK